MKRIFLNHILIGITKLKLVTQVFFKDGSQNVLIFQPTLKL